jgi:hypothetical protein
MVMLRHFSMIAGIPISSKAATDEKLLDATVLNCRELWASVPQYTKSQLVHAVAQELLLLSTSSY